MAEKIIGIKEKYWKKLFTQADCPCNDCKDVRSELVPAVSVEFAEKKIKKLIHHYNCNMNISPELFVSEMGDLISAIRKEASHE